MIARRAGGTPDLQCSRRYDRPLPAARRETAPSPPHRGRDRGGSIAWLVSSDDRDSIDRGAGSSNTSVHDIADGPQYRLHKGSRCRSKAASGFNPSRGPGSGLHRIRYNMAETSNGQRGRTRHDSSHENPGRVASGRDLYCRDVRSVGADVHGTQAHAAAGFDPALLQAAVQAGVDIDAAETDADGGAPAITQTMAPVMAVVKAAGGSRRCSGNGQRGGGDQPEGHLAKHCKYSPIIWREAVVASLPISRADDVLRSRAKGRIVFQECFVARDRRTSLSS